MLARTARARKVKLSPNCFQPRLVFKTVRETDPEYRSSLYNVILLTLQCLYIASAMLEVTGQRFRCCLINIGEAFAFFIIVMH